MPPHPPHLDAARGKPPWFSHAGKLVAAGASTGAALVSIFSALYSYGVIGKSETRQTIGNIGAAWVGLRPTIDTATAVGDTLHLAATITDKAGTILVGARPTWASENPNVAMVLKDGSVIARGPGMTTITVAVGDLIARSHIFVRQRVASVEVVNEGGDSTIVVPEADRQTLVARGLDARGHVVAEAKAQWHVDDSTVAVLDSGGAVIGKNAGRTIVSATIDGIAGHSALTVVSTAAAINALAGAEQRASAGAQLPQPVVVRVTSRRGRPVAATMVKFRPADGQGTVEPAAVFTDADGRARTVWTLGEQPGRQTLLASVEHVDSAFAIVAEADPIPKNTRVVALQERVSGSAGALVADTIAVRLTDTTGRALADVPISWTVLDGGSVVPIAARTDSLGTARAQWTLADRAGTQRVRAQVGVGRGGRGIAPVTILATALAGAATGMVIVSGDNQIGTVGVSLPKPISVRVVDATGNGVADEAVVLSPSTGALTDSVVRTDSLGLAKIRWTMGRSAGNASMGLHVDGVKKLLKVVAQARPATPANLTFEDAPDVRSSRAKGKPLVAVVTDAYGNPVPDATLSFTTKSGTVAPVRAVSDAAGRVKLAWTLGTKEGEQALVGSVRGTDVRGSFEVQVGETHVTTKAPEKATVKQAGKPAAKPTAAKLVPSKTSKKRS
jgi:hypothetical protein